MRIQSILFPVDFSPSGTAMAAYVKRAATIASAKVTLLYVLESSASAASGFELLARPLSEAEEDRKLAARAKLDSYLSSEFPGGDSPRLLVAGEAAAQIAEVARERGFDVIAMPTHAGVFRRMLLGSTTAKVLNDADCPVLTTQHAETITPRGLEHREWVCAIGLQPDSERVLRYANQAAETFHVNLTLVHAIPAGEPGLPVQFDFEERVQSEQRKAASRRIEELQNVVGSHARTIITVGPVKDTLTEAARRLRADVLVIGRSPETGAAGRLRDLTYAVVRDAPCPVLSV
ncbi:MAG TPA: universal stress protein [Terriglobia bacterium]|nr:universal stress protein [Terriglobia bacterium]